MVWSGVWRSRPPPPPHGMGGGGGGLAYAESGLAGWVGCCCGRPWVTGSQKGPGSYASPTQAINPITWGVFLFLLTLI